MQETLKVKTPEHVTLNFKLAGLGSRGAAQIVDTLIISLMYAGMIAAIIFSDTQLDRLLLEGRNMLIALFLVIIFVINWGYFFLFEWFTGGKTPGKILLGLRVVKEDGGKATALSILIRSLLRIIDMLPFYYLVGMLMIFFHPNHKRLGDIVAGTIVVHERKKGHSLKKESLVDKEIKNRGLTADYVQIGEWERQRITKDDWLLLKIFVERHPTLKYEKQREMAREVAGILFPKLGLDDGTTNTLEMENRLFASYLVLREDWEFGFR